MCCSASLRARRSRTAKASCGYAAEIDRPPDEFDRHLRAAAHHASSPSIDSCGRSASFSSVPSSRTKSARSARRDWRRPPDEGGEAVVDGRRSSHLADHQSFHRGIGEAAHAVSFEHRAPPVAQVDREPGKGEEDDHHAHQRHRHGQPAGRHRGRRKLDRRVGNDRDGRHGGEMQAADREREEQRSRALSTSRRRPMQPDRKRRRRR